MSDASLANNPQIPGYGYGAAGSAVSPLSLEDRAQLEETMGWTKEDAQALLRHADLFRAQAEAMVDAWRAVIGAQPHLREWFAGPDGKPDEEYKSRIRRRFVQWVIDVATRPHDRAWLNYQEEIGLRHTPAKKNVTDGSHTPPQVPLRYVLGFIPVVTPIRRFLTDGIADVGELETVERAWTKAVHLHVTLWARPYARDGLW